MKKHHHSIKILVLKEWLESLQDDIGFLGDGECPECHKPRVSNHLAERYDFQGFMTPDIRLVPMKLCVVDE